MNKKTRKKKKLVTQAEHFRRLEQVATVAFTQSPFKLELRKARKCAKMFVKMVKHS